MSAISDPASPQAYRDLVAGSLTDPVDFWGGAAGLVDWIHRPAQVLDDRDPHFPRWFPDGTLNVCYNALDRHVVHGRADQTALIYDSPVTDSKRQYSYSELLEEVSKFAGVMQGLGVGKGDRVVIYMPMIPEVPIAPIVPFVVRCSHSTIL